MLATETETQGSSRSRSREFRTLLILFHWNPNHEAVNDGTIVDRLSGSKAREKPVRAVVTSGYIRSLVIRRAHRRGSSARQDTSPLRTLNVLLPLSNLTFLKLLKTVTPTDRQRPRYDSTPKRRVSLSFLFFFFEFKKKKEKKKIAGKKGSRRGLWYRCGSPATGEGLDG
jgi:hypothetical protein